MGRSAIPGVSAAVRSFAALRAIVAVRSAAASCANDAIILAVISETNAAVWMHNGADVNADAASVNADAASVNLTSGEQEAALLAALVFKRTEMTPN